MNETEGEDDGSLRAPRALTRFWEDEAPVPPDDSGDWSLQETWYSHPLGKLKFAEWTKAGVAPSPQHTETEVGE